jgi:hypothetical protein
VIRSEHVLSKFRTFGDVVILCWCMQSARDDAMRSVTNRNSNQPRSLIQYTEH